MIFDKGAYSIQWRKQSLLNKCCLNNGAFLDKKNLQLKFIPKKNKLEEMITLNIKGKMIKLLEENSGENLYDLELGKECLKTTSMS